MLTFAPRTFTSLARVAGALAALRQGVSGDVRRRGAEAGAQLLTDAAVARVPRGPETDPPHTHLRDTVGWRTYTHTRQLTTIGIGTDEPRGEMLEFGTAPHVITPRVAGALFWAGGRHPVMRVRHPGTRARPWLRPALTDTRAPAGNAVRDAIVAHVTESRGASSAPGGTA